MKFQIKKKPLPKTESFFAKWQGQQYPISKDSEVYFYVNNEKITLFLAQDGDEFPLAEIETEIKLYALDDEHYNKISELEDKEFKPSTGYVFDIDAIFEMMVKILKNIPDIESES